MPAQIVFIRVGIIDKGAVGCAVAGRHADVSLPRSVAVRIRGCVCAVSGSAAAGGMFYLLQILLKLGYVAVKLRLFALLFGAVVGLFLLLWLISTVIAAVCACRRAFFFRKGVLANFFAIAVLAF